jgi:hypothetical protein
VNQAVRGIKRGDKIMTDRETTGIVCRLKLIYERLRTLGIQI